MAVPHHKLYCIKNLNDPKFHLLLIIIDKYVMQLLFMKLKNLTNCWQLLTILTSSCIIIVDFLLSNSRYKYYIIFFPRINYVYQF